jgi:hypothetical protein
MSQRTPSADPSAEHPVVLNVQMIEKLEREALGQQSVVERVTAAITRICSMDPAGTPE